jgi:hypothetical protein
LEPEWGRDPRFIRSPQAVLLLAACRDAKSDRLLGEPKR